MHGSSGVLSVASDARISHTVSGGGGLIPSISCRSTVSDTEYETVSVMHHRTIVMRRNFDRSHIVELLFVPKLIDVLVRNFCCPNFIRKKEKRTEHSGISSLVNIH